MQPSKEHYGTLSDGRGVDQYTLENANGLVCKVITYGGIVTELHVPDDRGTLGDVVLGLPSLKAYEKGHPYLGAIIGRVAGRITGGGFELDGETYQLAVNQPPNHLHGGEVGLDKRVWEASGNETADGEPFVKLFYLSPAGEEGYPGNLSIEATYTLTNRNGLRIDYRATTDRATPFCPTNHSYFNLAGEDAPGIADHELQVFSDTIVPGDVETGTLSGVETPVEGTPHDFREPRKLGDFIVPPGRSHGENYLFRDGDAADPQPAAVLTEPSSGRKMEVLTTTTGMQLYTGKFLEDMELVGKSGKRYRNHSAVCLECQGYPDGVNRPEIDDIVLRPGDTYRQTTVYRFSVR